MKKYLSGAIAIVFAIALSSFTISHGTVKRNNAQDPSYQWYAVTYNTTYPNGAVLSGSAAFGGIAQTQSYADAHDGCSGSPKDCLRGYTSAPSFPDQSPGNAQTKKN